MVTKKATKKLFTAKVWIECGLVFNERQGKARISYIYTNGGLIESKSFNTKKQCERAAVERGHKIMKKPVALSFVVY